MAERVSFSNEQLSLDDIDTWRDDVLSGLRQFFCGGSAALTQRYADEEIENALQSALAELDLTSSLSVLSSVEAGIRLDYLRRVYGRLRDPLSRAMSALHQDKMSRARLEGDLLRLWRDRTSMRKGLLAELAHAFQYRHWLAHGRYWRQKLGRQYDYDSLFELANEFNGAMQEHTETSKSI